MGRAEQRRLAEMPGRYVNWLENLTVATLGPIRYRTLLLPVYEEAVPIPASSEKGLFVHFDGRLSDIRNEVPAAPFHGIDSLTEPPEGDMIYDVCRRAWPDKVFWGHINAGLFGKPEDDMRRAVADKRWRPGKHGLAFEISEDRPGNWQEMIPVVLDTLAGLD